MFIADSLIWYEVPESPNWLGGTIVGVLVGMLVLGGVGAWVARRGNRDLDKTLARQRTETDASLDALQVPPPDKPDFSFLAEVQRQSAPRDADARSDDAESR
jgi:hypothetical protein